jgi:hypothetical protein
VLPADPFNTQFDREERMSDDKTKAGKPDRDRINVREKYELRDWSKKFGVTLEQLKAAVEVVGPMAENVRRHLNSARHPI